MKNNTTNEGTGKAYFSSQMLGEWTNGEEKSLYWNTLARPIGIKKLPSGFWEIILAGKQSNQYYTTEKLAKIDLVQKVCWELRDQVRSMYALLNTLESEKQMESK